MAEERKGRLPQSLEGKERSEVYTRSKITTSRWTLFWDIFKERFGRLMLTNLATLLTCLPLIAVIVWRMYWDLSQGVIGNYGTPGIFLPFLPYVEGTAEWITFLGDLLFFALMLPGLAIAGLGVSGGAYIMRNLVWTKGIFVFSDFLRGIRRNFWCVLEAMFVFGFCHFASRTVGNYADYHLALGSSIAGWLIASKVIGYIILAFSIPVSLWMVALGIGYRQGPWALFKNAVIMTVATFPQTILFAAIAAAPVLLTLFGGWFSGIATILLATFTVSFALLVWMVYTDWAIGKFILGESGATVEEEGEAPKEQKAQPEKKSVVTLYGKSVLLSRPMQPMSEGGEPYELPTAFTREDLEKLAESKAAIYAAAEAYAEEHRGEPKYAEYNSQFEQRERALTQQVKKKKKVKRPKMLLR